MKQNKKKNNIGKVKAFINLRIEEDDKCTLNWKGDTVHLADMLFTAMHHDERIAAVICQTAKDYIDTAKGDLDKWKRLTVECARVLRDMTQRYHTHPVTDTGNGDQKQQGKDMEEPDRNDRKEAKYVHD